MSERARKAVIDQAVRELLAGNEHAKAAHDKIVAVWQACGESRVQAEARARDEIGRVLLGCLWAAHHGGGPLADFTLALDRLLAGESAVDIFGT